MVMWVSERRACQLVGLSRTVLYYALKAKPENERLKARLIELTGERRRFGYRRLHTLVRREGVQANSSGSLPRLAQSHSNLPEAEFTGKAIDHWTCQYGSS